MNFSVLSGYTDRLKNSSFARNVAETLFTRIVLLAVGMVSSIVVSRVLGPVGRGEYALALSIGALGIQFANLGLPSSNTYFVAKDPSLLSPLIGNTLVVGLGVGTLGAILAYLYFLIFPSIAPVHGWLLILSLVWVPFGLAYLLSQNILLGIHKIRAFNAIELTTKVLIVMGILGAVLVHQVSTISLFVVSLSAVALSFVWSLLSLRDRLQGVPKPSFPLFRETFGYGIKTYLATLFAFLVTRVDLFFINGQVGPKEAGYYSVAMALSDLISIIPVVIGSLLFPKLSSIKDFREQKVMVRKVALVSTGITYSAILILVVLARFIIRLLFGHDFVPAADPFFWLAIGLFLLPIYNAYGQFISAVGSTYYYVAGWGIAFAVKVVCSWFIIKFYGYRYVGVGNAAVYLIVILTCVWYLNEVKGRNAQTLNG